MKIIAEYSFKNGKAIIENEFADLLLEIKDVISEVDASKCKTKISKEKTMKGKVLYAPKKLNLAFKLAFERRKWTPMKLSFTTRVPEIGKPHRGYREMDAVKGSLGAEVQFGKYAFMAYDILAKMVIFSKLGHIRAGVEIVPMGSLMREMSTGVSSFEQIKTDLEQRGHGEIDIPVLVYGIDATRVSLESFAAV